MARDALTYTNTNTVSLFLFLLLLCSCVLDTHSSVYRVCPCIYIYASILCSTPGTLLPIFLFVVGNTIIARDIKSRKVCVFFVFMPTYIRLCRCRNTCSGGWQIICSGCMRTTCRMGDGFRYNIT